MMKKIYRKAFALPWVHRLLHGLVGTYSATLRLTFKNEEMFLKQLQDGRRVLLCAWHQQFFSLIYPFRRYAAHHPALMISRSADGELIAGIARESGWYPVRGSSTEGGKEALKAMIRHLKKHRLAGHVVDGPLGPMGQVKPGAVYLALAAGAVVVPITVKADRAWFFNSWDRFFIPRPFARVAVCFGNPMRLPRPRSDDEFEALRQQIEKSLQKGLYRHPAEEPL